MEEVTSNVIIAVIMGYLVCHEVMYSGRNDPFFGTFFLDSGVVGNREQKDPKRAWRVKTNQR